MSMVMYKPSKRLKYYDNPQCGYTEGCDECKEIIEHVDKFMKMNTIFSKHVIYMNELSDFIISQKKHNWLDDYIGTLIKEYEEDTYCYYEFAKTILYDFTTNSKDEYLGRRMQDNYKDYKIAIYTLFYGYFGDLTKINPDIFSHFQLDIKDYIYSKKVLLKTVLSTSKISSTKTRVGQDLFRKKLISIDCKCKICGVEDENFLIASHIKPWEQGDDAERVDLYNGFLLCPNHDKLFDKGYISFNDEGKILISSELTEETRKKMNIHNEIKINLYYQNIKYLQYHRNNKFIK